MAEVNKLRIFYDTEREEYGFQLGDYERDEAMIILGYLEMAKTQIVGHYANLMGNQIRP